MSGTTESGSTMNAWKVPIICTAVGAAAVGGYQAWNDYQSGNYNAIPLDLISSAAGAAIGEVAGIIWFICCDNAKAPLLFRAMPITPIPSFAGAYAAHAVAKNALGYL